MPTDNDPLDDLIPPSRPRLSPERSMAVGFSFNIEDAISEVAARLREGDPELLAQLGITDEAPGEDGLPKT